MVSINSQKCNQLNKQHKNLQYIEKSNSKNAKKISINKTNLEDKQKNTELQSKKIEKTTKNKKNH